MRGGARGCGGLGGFSWLSKVPGAAILGGPRRVFSQTRDSADPNRAGSPHLPTMWSIARVTASSTAQQCTGQPNESIALDNGTRQTDEVKLRQRSKVRTAAVGVVRGCGPDSRYWATSCHRLTTQRGSIYDWYRGSCRSPRLTVSGNGDSEACTA